MYTQCPHCLSVYQPTPHALARGRGRLRCGVCENDFDALERLTDQPIHAAAPAVTPSSTAVRLDPDHPPQQGHLFEPAAPESPTFVTRETARGGTRSNGAWWAGSLALALLLGAQIVLAQRAELARDPQWRAWLQTACAHLRCSLPAWRDIGALRISARDVRPHPSVPDALMISATFRNDAPWPQAWPVLQISLADLDGKAVALRRFEPAEYLGSAPREPTLGPGQSATATLEVQDPGKHVVAYSFEFL
jgi:predicted Zn finger-like uncharacterized protein